MDQCDICKYCYAVGDDLRCLMTEYGACEKNCQRFEISPFFIEGFNNVIKIEIPEIPPSLNKFGNTWHYHKRAAEKRRWRDMIKLLCNNLKPSEPFQKAKIIIRYYFPTKGKRDPDNYSGKFILDGLISAGILKDDSFAHVTLQLEGDYDKENPRTEVEVIPYGCQTKA